MNGMLFSSLTDSIFLVIEIPALKRPAPIPFTQLERRPSRCAVALSKDGYLRFSLLPLHHFHLANPISLLMFFGKI
jgi:hypothetical protein